MALRIFFPSNATLSLAPVLESKLSPPNQNELRRLLSAAPPSINACQIGIAVNAFSKLLLTYCTTLTQPRASVLEINEAFACLATETNLITSSEDWPKELYFPMWRSMSNAPVWALLLMAGQGDLPSAVQEAMGAELALCLATRKPFKKSLATRLLKSAKNGTLDTELQDPILAKQMRAALRQANVLFESTELADAPSFASDLDRFNAEVANFFRATRKHARDKDHQAVIDHRAQSVPLMKASATSLRKRAEQGDDNAIQIIIAVLAGIPVDLSRGIPILGPWLADWMLAIDLEEGCIKTLIQLFTNGRAVPKQNSGDSLVAAGDVIVKPMPRFLWESLQAKLESSPDAKTACTLLPQGEAKPTGLTLSMLHAPRIKPSVARLTNGIGKFAVELGINRYLAAVITSNQRIVPRGKFYYAQASREEIWDAARILYAGLGWGDPVPLLDGLPVGSRVTPKDQTLRAWFKWMEDQVKGARPGRRYSLRSLIEHHNQFAKCSASLATFLLALRERNPMLVTSADFAGPRTTVPVDDKNVGLVPGPRPVPIAPALASQIDLWMEHCREFARRIEKLGIPQSPGLAARLREVLAGDSVPQFFLIDEELCPLSIAAGDLANWWPSQFGLEGNFARHYWQTALRREGVASTDIDAFVRHSMRGADQSASTGHTPQIEWMERVLAALARVLARLGITAVAGLKGKR